MAQVINTQWIKEGLGGSADDNGVITQNESVIITFDEVVGTLTDARSFSGFIAGQRHRNDNKLILQPNFDGNVHPDDNARVWIFDLEYSTAGFNEVSYETETYTPKVEISKWTYNRTVVNDKESGDPILLPTGEPYDAAFLEQVSAPIISITVKEYSHNIQRIEEIGSINDNEIRIAGITCPKYCAMLDDYQVRPHEDDKGYLTFQNTFKIKMKFAKNNEGQQIGFKVETLAASFNEVKDGELVAIKVADPEDPTNREADILAATPQMVDANGAKTSKPYYQEWVTDDLTDFSRFGLPTSFPRS